MPAKGTTVRIVRNALLAFVLITIGFAFGKESARRRFAASMPAGHQNATTNTVANSEAGTRVVVYYAHTALRCVTCNTIEDLAHGALKSRFADELAQGAVEWRVVNFQEDENFAKRYEIVSSSVVVVGIKGDIETGYERLDEVWTKVNDPAAFEEYVVQAVRKLLSEKGAVSE